MRTRFEAVFDDGDDDRRPNWRVVEWTDINPANGAAMGRTAVRDCINEASAVAQADRLNLEYYKHQGLLTASEKNFAEVKNEYKN